MLTIISLCKTPTSTHIANQPAPATLRDVGFSAIVCPMDRFWEKVDKNGPIPEEKPHLGRCWIWSAGLGAGNYGQFYQNGKNIGAHRMSYMLTHNLTSIPYLTYILHKCDIRLCVNPDHLYAGTALDNARDTKASGHWRNIRHGS